MKRLFFCLSVLGMMLTGCSKNDDGKSDKPNNNGNEQPENPNEPKLPELPDPDDVCSAMDDLNFMAYCYENFDVNKNGKVSLVEANAVKKIDILSKQIKSLKGIERFPNLESLLSCDNPIEELDLRYNLQIVTTSVSSSYDIGTFQGCRNLKKILLPSTLKAIEKSAFLRCSSLTEIHLPASLTSIGESAFRVCSSLTEINFPASLTSIGESAFRVCSSLTEINFPASLTSIGEYTFYDCSSLTEIHLPANLTSIGRSTFSCCSSLTEINLPASLTSIEMYAFYGCSSLTKVTCHALVPLTLGVSSFDFKSIENLYVPAESIQAYKDSPWASYFKNILPIE